MGGPTRNLRSPAHRLQEICHGISSNESRTERRVNGLVLDRNCTGSRKMITNPNVRRVVAMALLGAALLAGRAEAQSQSQEVQDRVTKATVMVFTAISRSSEGDTPMGSGSGYFVNRTGLCITNDHVIDPTHGKNRYEKQRQEYSELNRPVWTVIVDSGTEDETTYKARVLYSNDKADQAIMQVYNDEGGFLDTPNYLELLPSDQVHIGLKAWCYGFPGGDSRKSEQEHPPVAISDGHVVDLPRRPDGDLKMITCDVRVDPGNSGGPVMDVHGRVLGTATLKPPAEVAGRTDQSALVPADLTREFITIAFQRNKLESGIDLEPFYTLLVGRDGYADVPAFPRSTSTDCLMFEGGDRMCGEPEGDTITLPTPLGDLKLPRAHMAYLLKQEKDPDMGIVLMDGGQRVPYFRTEAVIRFTPTGGKTFEQKLSDVKAVVFRKGGELPSPPEDKCMLVSGSEYHLYLRDVEGTASFSTKHAGGVSLPLGRISSVIETEDDQIVYTVDGSKMRGEFSGDKIKARLTLSDTPQDLSLEYLGDATFRTVDPSEKSSQRRGIAELYVDARPDLQEIARIIDTGEPDRARPMLDRHLEAEYFNKQGGLRQDRIRLLDGVCRWRAGDWDGALRQFKKLRASKDDGLKWYAEAVLAVHERYPDGKYDGKPLSDPKVYRAAGKIVAEEHVHKALEILVERDAPPPESRAHFGRLRRSLDESTQELMIASRLDHPSADDAMIQVWNMEEEILFNEVYRVNDELAETREELGKLSGRQLEWKGRELEKQIQLLERNLEATQEWMMDVKLRMRDIGFINDDPDKGITPYR